MDAKGSLRQRVSSTRRGRAVRIALPASPRQHATRPHPRIHLTAASPTNHQSHTVHSQQPAPLTTRSIFEVFCRSSLSLLSLLSLCPVSSSLSLWSSPLSCRWLQPSRSPSPKSPAPAPSLLVSMLPAPRPRHPVAALQLFSSLAASASHYPPLPPTSAPLATGQHSTANHHAAAASRVHVSAACWSLTAVFRLRLCIIRLVQLH